MQVQVSIPVLIRYSIEYSSGNKLDSPSPTQEHDFTTFKPNTDDLG